MKIVKKVLLIIITILLILLVAFNAYNFFSLKVLKHKLTTVGGYSLLEVVSGSMEPTIHVGDMIIINTKASNYQENDIVTFLDVNGSFVTHRIVSINNEEMITKGDFNNTEDEPTKIDKIVGKYVSRIPGAGKLLSSFKNPFTLVMILIIGLLFCYLISTDKNGNPIFTEEEKEFFEYQKEKNKPKANKKKKKKKEASKQEKIQKERESIEQELETLFKEKREINKQIRVLLEKKEILKKTNNNYHKNNYRKNYYNNTPKRNAFDNQKNNRKKKSGE